MAGRRRFFSLGLIAALAAVGGTAWAVTQSGDPNPVKRTSGVLAQGLTAGGDGYTISRIDAGAFGMAPTRAFCTQISTSAAGAQGCHLVPDKDGRVAGQELRIAPTLLGGTRFFTTLAPEGVTAMEVRVKGEAKAAASRSLDAGSAGTLLVAVVEGPIVSSRDPASSRDYEVRLLGADGETVHEVAASDPELD
jgi:hypothetical protein